MLRRALFLGLAMVLMACGHAPPPRPAGPAAVQAHAERRPEDGVPEQARLVLRFVRAHGEAPAGIQGGRTFGNYERRLPQRDESGQAIRYQEWDLWPKVRGRNRGAERLVTGSDGRAWYTGDHYRTFQEVRL
jgi:guanyl-specific ribonuclease Sa